LTNRYEDPTQRLHSHNWSEEYKENHGAIFGVKYKLFYSNGDQATKTFKNKEEAGWYIYNEGDHLTGFIEV
jgi:hypothetical protein